MKSKCMLIFVGGMVVSLTAMAFFGPMMQMPQQMMNIMNPQPNMVQSTQPCVCECKVN